jgi:transcriptional regulator GlxA family with amidase domain
MPGNAAWSPIARATASVPRVSRAADLPASLPLSVKEAMVAAGFSDPSHFAKDFRRRFGASPSARRERLGVEETSTSA